MKILAMILCIAGLVALLFGTWGRYAPAGRARFDEMAGMIPYAAFYAGIGMMVLSALIFGWLLVVSGGGEG